jgi:tRNA A-37 threonylcarbamoyl transferase component Bud32
MVEATEKIPGTDGEHRISNVPAPTCEALRELGLTQAAGPLAGEPLSGGVSCDIWRVDLPEGPVCAKKALAKLKVAGEWFAPTSRIDFEAAYYRFARTVEPGVTPEVLGHDPSRGVLVTEYLPSSEHTVWKDELQNGVVRTDLVRQLALTLRHLHDRSLADSQAHAAFNQPDLIHALRLSPYFLASIPANPELESELTELVNLFERNRHWLIHGDFSPKNILFGRDHPVILDAECANTGDAAFDLAFCSAHLCLKAAWKTQHTSKYKAAFDTFYAAYFEAGTDSDLDTRAARYLSGFLLARMDGKSPVEYITAPADKAAIRNFARNHLKQTPTSLRTLAEEWFSDWASRSDKRETQA